VNLLSLLCSGGLAGTNSPDRLVGNNDLTEVSLAEVEYRTLELCLYDLVLLVSFTLSQ